MPQVNELRLPDPMNYPDAPAEIVIVFKIIHEPPSVPVGAIGAEPAVPASEDNPPPFHVRITVVLCAANCRVIIE